MIRVNLLPHRAEKRKAVVVGFVHVAISGQISYQERRNQYLKEEIAVLDKQIEEIKKLREQTAALLSRKMVVEGLQSTRSDVVHLLDQMLRIVPEGVYWKTLKQTGNKIHLVGYAQSNARISTLMRSIEDSPWLESPILVVIQATTADKMRMNEFTLNFNLSKQTPPASPVAPAKAAAAKGPVNP